MKTTYQIEITNPCSENWGSFKSETPTTKYCDSCSKSVTDFTGMGNREMLNYLSNHPNTCGRFRKDQLGIHEKELFTNRLKTTLGLFKAGILSFLLSIGNSREAIGQDPSTGEQIEWNQLEPSELKKEQPSDSSFIAKGVVRSEEDSSGLPGINIYLKGRMNGTTTDIDGKFEFPIPLKIGDTLVFTFIGMLDQEWVITSIKELTIRMSYNTMVLGESLSIVVGGVRYRRFSFLGRWWSGVTGVFRK